MRSVMGLRRTECFELTAGNWVDCEDTSLGSDLCVWRRPRCSARFGRGTRAQVATPDVYPV